METEQKVRNSSLTMETEQKCLTQLVNHRNGTKSA